MEQIKVVEVASLIKFIKQVNRAGFSEETKIKRIITEIEQRAESLSEFSARKSRDVKREKLERFYDDLAPVIKQARAEGKQTVYAVTLYLNAKGLKSFYGRAFREQQVKAILNWYNQRESSADVSANRESGN